MVDFRAFGIRERESILMQAVDKLPNCSIFYDDAHIGNLPTALRAWSMPSVCSHICVIQDDIELCDDFAVLCEAITKAQPNAIISLFPFEWIPITDTDIERIQELDSPYVKVPTISGCGVIMPAGFVTDMLELQRTRLGYCRYDDDLITEYARMRHCLMLSTVPALIQHLGDVSVIDNTRSVRRTPWFSKRPIANWASTQYTTVTMSNLR